jgi:hypothetical protein
VDAIGLATAISRKVQRIADYDAGTAVPAREAEYGALITARLCAFNRKERLRDSERVGERDTDATRAHIKAEPELGLRSNIALYPRWILLRSHETCCAFGQTADPSTARLRRSGSDDDTEYRSVACVPDPLP